MYREDNNKNLIWGPKAYGGSAGEILRDIINTDDGGFLLLSSSNSSDGDVGFHYGGAFNNDIWVFKVNGNGDIVWSKVFGGTDEEHPIRIIPCNEGHYITAYTYSTDYDCIGNHGESDLLVIKIDTAGNKLS